MTRGTPYRIVTLPFLGFAVFVVLAAGVLAPQQARAQMARAEMRNPAAEVIGTATLTDDSDGVRIALRLSKLPPGLHGFHVHAVGRCDPPTFDSAGGHFNPEVRKHGRQNPDGWHAGDLQNIVAAGDGTVDTEVVVRDVTLGSPVNSHSLFPPTGTALVIHAKADDERTDPSGNAGPRIACGVISR